MIELNDEAAKDLVEGVMKTKICAPFTGIIIWRGREICGAVVFNNYEGRDIHLTVVQDGPVSLADARRISRYVFEQLCCERVTAVTRESNMKARCALTRLGFMLEGVLRKHYDEEDGLVYGLLKTEQRVLRNGFKS